MIETNVAPFEVTRCGRVIRLIRIEYFFHQRWPRFYLRNSFESDNIVREVAVMEMERLNVILLAKIF